MLALPITSSSADLAKVEALYRSAFPENERGPFSSLLDDSTHCSEIFALYEDTVFCGFFSLFSYADISHIIYFAIEPSLRGKGCGAAALALLRQLKPHQRLLADIEAPTPAAPNNAQRARRKAFYLRGGYSPSEVSYPWRDDDYEILVSGGELTESGFWDFWEAVALINPDYEQF